MSLKFNQILIVFLSLFLFSCGSDDEATIESLSGKYVVTKVETKNCVDSEENMSISGNTTNGVCQTEDDIEVCINICTTFSNGSYTSEYTITGGGFTFSSMDSGTYDPTDNASTICIDGDCGNVSVENGGDKFVFSGTDPDTGCSISIEMEKA